MEYCRGKMLGVDVVNEAGAILDGGGWIKYLGYDCVDFAFETAHGVDPGMPLYYNSFFASAEDEALAVYLLENDLADGIGIQLHLEASTDYQEKFLRAERLLRCCRKNHKTARISEVTVYDPENNLEHIGIIFRDTAFLAKDNRDVVTDYTVWGVKYPAWNGRHVLFDSKGKQTPAYYGIVNELVRGGL
jgi:GH35 family endo-1,4-beta-xylanase